MIDAQVRARRVLVVSLIVIAAYASVAVALGDRLPLRALAVFVCVVLAPGMAITGFLRLPDLHVEVAVAVPLSLAIGVGLAELLTTAAAWHPHAGFVVITVMSALALGAQVLRRGSHRGHLERQRC